MQTTEQEEPPLLTIEESAKYLGISRSSVYRLINERQISTVKILVRKQRISKNELDQFITDQSTPRNAQVTP